MMKLVTRCPECGTAFRVYEEQLEARGGQVRCGFCKQVFDAYSSLEERSPEMDGPPTLAMARDTTPAPAAPEASPAPPKQSTALPEPRRVEIGAAKKTPSDRTYRVEPSLEYEADDIEERSFEFSPAKQTDRTQTIVWSGVIALLTLFLALEIAYLLRGDIMARFPSTRGVVLSGCRLLGCDVALPRITENVVIESSDLQSDGAGTLTLTTVLRNKATFTQALPALELTLTDGREQPVARKILRPLDYLDMPMNEAHGIAAGGDVVAKVYIDASQLPASGYKLFVFYP